MSQKKEKTPKWYEPLDSPEEAHFEWWMMELSELGYIDSYVRAKTYHLVDSIAQPYLHERVSIRTREPLSPQRKKKTLRSKLKYTPDFEITWNIKALGIFFVEHDVPTLMNGPVDHHMLAHFIDGDLKSIVEVKPKVFGRSPMNVSRLAVARMNSMYLYDKMGIYTNLVEIGTTLKSLFDQTFTPAKYLLTDLTGKPRAIKFQPRTADEFLEKTEKLKYIIA